MSNAYERMKQLLALAGLTTEDGGINDAEMYAYAAGLNAVSELLEAAENSLTGAQGIRRFASLLVENAKSYQDTALEALVKRRGAYRYAMLTAEDYEAELALTGLTGVTAEHGAITLQGLRAANAPAVAAFLRAFIPVGKTVKADGSGMPFDAWDAAGLPFREYDALLWPFDILDTLRSDTFEQHE